jgi:predicted transcriptional regulator
MNVHEVSSHEIEICTGIAQPEISLALKLMQKHSWVNVRLEKKLGKGRPINIYSLVAPISVIMDYYEKEIQEEYQATVTAIEKVRTMSKKIDKD